ncbi:oligosaccharide repeat unit polymerase family protein [Pyrococcus abyssi]|nr:hypothetical protein [Pyrococcus abyssi]CCE69471.1 TPA: hypothetical protein PAB0055 [Pyrococcus abyssi GE5]
METSEKVFLTLLLTFLALASLGKGNIKVQPLLYALAFTGLFVAGLNSRLRIPDHFWPLLSLLVISPLGFRWIIIWVGIVIPLAIYIRVRGDLRPLKATLVFTSILLPLIPAIFGLIPILNPQTRFHPLSILYVLSGYSIALLNSITPSILITILGILIGVMSMYRSVIALSILPLIYRGKVSIKLIVFALLGVLLISIGRGVGVEDIVHRPSFTYGIYEKLYEVGMPWGKIMILPEPIPGYKVAAMFGGHKRYTYTIFGEAVADFGILGLFEGFLLGLCIRKLRKLKWAHAFGLTILSLGIEVGLDAFKLATLFILPFLGRDSNES